MPVLKNANTQPDFVTESLIILLGLFEPLTASSQKVSSRHGKPRKLKLSEEETKA